MVSTPNPQLSRASVPGNATSVRPKQKAVSLTKHLLSPVPPMVNMAAHPSAKPWAQNPRRHFHLPYHRQIQGLSSSSRWAPERQLSLGAPLLPLFLFLFIYLLLWLYQVLVVAHSIFCGTRHRLQIVWAQ